MPIHRSLGGSLTRTHADIDHIVEQLTQRDLSKAERLAFLKKLVQSGEDLPEEWMEEAVSKLMDRLSD